MKLKQSSPRVKPLNTESRLRLVFINKKRGVWEKSKQTGHRKFYANFGQCSSVGDVGKIPEKVKANFDQCLSKGEVGEKTQETESKQQ